MGLEAEKATERMAQMVRVCREAGMRITPQRQAIYEEMAATDEHPDAEMIFRKIRERMPTVSLDTVYRTIGVLEERGLVWRVGVVEGRGRFDANTEAHHHLICKLCGRVEDVWEDPWPGFEMPAGAREWGRVERVHLQIWGICARCLRGDGAAGC